MLNNNSA